LLAWYRFNPCCLCPHLPAPQRSALTYKPREGAPTYLHFPRLVLLQHETEQVCVGARQQPEVQGALGERQLLEEHCKGTADVHGQPQAAAGQGTAREVNPSMEKRSVLLRLIVEMAESQSEIHNDLYFQPPSENQ